MTLGGRRLAGRRLWSPWGLQAALAGMEREAWIEGRVKRWNLDGSHLVEWEPPSWPNVWGEGKKGGGGLDASSQVLGDWTATRE